MAAGPTFPFSGIATGPRPRLPSMSTGLTFRPTFAVQRAADSPFALMHHDSPHDSPTCHDPPSGFAPMICTILVLCLTQPSAQSPLQIPFQCAHPCPPSLLMYVVCVWAARKGEDFEYENDNLYTLNKHKSSDPQRGMCF